MIWIIFGDGGFELPRTVNNELADYRLHFSVELLLRTTETTSNSLLGRYPNVGKLWLLLAALSGTTGSNASAFHRKCYPYYWCWW